MSRTRADWKFLAFTFSLTIYAIFLARRSLWIDEIQAIQISRENPKVIFQLLGYERHPMGWYLVLKFIAFVSTSLSLDFILTLKIFQFSVLAKTLSVIRRLGLPLSITIFLMVSPTLVIIPGLLLRPYLFANLLLILAIIYLLRENYYRAILTLVFLCQLHVIYALISLLLYLIMAREIRFQKIYLQLCFLSSLAISLIVAWPESDSVSHTTINDASLGDLPKGVLLSVAPFLSTLPVHAQYAVSLIVFVVLVYFLLLLARISRLVFLVMTCVILAAIFSFTFLKGTQPWHLTFVIATMVAIFGSIKREIASSNVLRLCVGTLLLCQLLSIPFGLSRNLLIDHLGGVDDYMKIALIHCDDKLPIATNDHLAMYLSFSFRRPVYNLQTGAFQSFINWKVSNQSDRGSLQSVDLSTVCIFSDSSKLNFEGASEMKFVRQYENQDQGLYDYFVFLAGGED